VKDTIKEKALLVRDFILAHGKIVFPIFVIAAVALTVVFALRERNPKITETTDDGTGVELTVSGDNTGEETGVIVPNVPFEENAYPEINALILAYFNAMAEGDADTIEGLQGSLDNMERIKIVELGKYIERYPGVIVYTKPGPVENSFIAIAYTTVILSYYPEDYLPGYMTFYICPKEEGGYYINQENESEEVLEYIRQVMAQDDVVELCNRITVECNDIYLAKPELLNYMAEVEQQVKTSAGEILAHQQVSGGDVASVGDGETGGGEDASVSGSDGTQDPVTEPEPTGPIYAAALDNVNVRSSDSVTADKLGRVTAGTRVKIIEQLVNGWSKIEFEGKEGYIKSEYLYVLESVADVEIIGTVTANTKVNVRSQATTDSTKVGVAVQGDTFDLVAYEGDWCKIVYEGQIAYIKAEFLD